MDVSCRRKDPAGFSGFGADFFVHFPGRLGRDLFKFLTDAAISFFLFSHTKYPALASFQTAAAADATIYDDQGRVSQSLLVGGLVNNHREPCHEE
jgi:hypothetical protein